MASFSRSQDSSLAEVWCLPKHCLSFPSVLITMRLLLLFVWLVGSTVLGLPFGKTRPAKVLVCQNKDCCRQWPHQQGLPDTLQDLLPPHVDVSVEVTGCLSQCGKGPNIVLHKSDGSHITLNSMSGPMHLVVELEDHFEIRIPSKLVAAVTVMDKARKGEI